jgi:integrase
VEKIVSAQKKPARLYLRTRKGRPTKYVILDDGREYDCGTGNEREAQGYLAQYLATRFVANTGQRDPAKISVAEIMTLYMQEVAPRTAAPALIGYHAAHLLAYFGKKTIADFNGVLCRGYADARTKTVQPATARREMQTLQAAINYWHKESPLAAVPVITMPAKGIRRQRYLTRNEVARLLWAARRLGHKHIARFILIGVYTGTRHDAILKLKWHSWANGGHIDVSGSKLFRKGFLEIETNKKRPTSRIPDRLMAHVRRWERSDLARGPQSAIIRWRGQPIAKERRAWALTVAAANLGNDVTPHVLRHTCATWALQSGMELWDIAGLTGMSIKTLESTYGHQDANFQLAAKSAFMGNHGRKTGTK